MMLRQLLVLSLLAASVSQATAAIVDGVRQKPKPQTSGFVADQEAYLYNIEAQAFFTQGNSWATQASIGDEGRKVNFVTVAEGVYRLTNFCWRDANQQGGFMAEGWRDVFFDSETAIFVDRNNQSNYLWEIADNGDGTFRLMPSAQNATISNTIYPGMYVGLNYAENPSSTTISPLLLPGEGHYIDWAMVSTDEYAEIAQKMSVYGKAQELKTIIDNIKALGGSASDAEAVYLNEGSTLEELEAAISDAQTAYVQAIINNAADKENVDVTIMLENPRFEEEENGWTVIAAPGSGANGRDGNVRPGGSSSNRCYEAWNSSSFDIYQIVQNAPLGVYEIEVQGFYRYLRGNNAWNAYQKQESQYVKKGGVPVYIYMNNNATPFVNVFDEPVPVGELYTNSVADDTYTDPNGQYWYPNQMNSSAEAFSAGMYKQSAFGLVARDGDVMRLGVKGVSNQGNDSWVIWDNFKLTFRGFKADVIEPVLEAEIANVNETYIGLLMGRTEYAAFTTALADAAKAIELNDGEGMFNALNALYDAKDPALISKDIFLAQEVAADTLRLAEAIRAMEGKKLSIATLDNAGTLLDGLKNNALYENEQIDQLKSDVTDMINALDNSVALYEQLNEAIGRLQAAITEFSGEDVIVSKDVLDGANALLSTSTADYNEGSIADSDIPGRIDSIDKAIEGINESVRLYEQLANAISELKDIIVDAKKEPLINDQLINAADNLVGTANENYANRNLDNNAVKELIDDIQTEVDGLRRAIGALYFSVYPLTYHITSLSEDNLTVEVSSCSLDYTGDLYIPDTVTYNGKTYTVTGIAAYAFRACVFITTIHVGENVKEIGTCAFIDMTGLVYIYIPSTLISMGSGCFDGCSSIKGLNYFGSSDSDITLDYDEGTDEIIVVVEVWNGITSVTLPSTLKRIGERAFWGCFKLMTVTSKIEDLFPIDEDVFSDATYLFGTLVVPDGMADVYRRTPGWSKFQNIVEASAVGINATESKNLDDSNIYTIGGLKVNDKQKKGLYIKNGKKVVE